MHRPPRSRTDWGTLSGLRRSHSGTALENWLPTNGHASGRTLSGLWRALRNWGRRPCRRRSVNRAWSRLWSDHTTEWSRRGLRALLLRGIRNRRCSRRRSRRLRNLNRCWGVCLNRRRARQSWAASRRRRSWLARRRGALSGDFSDLGFSRYRPRSRWRRRRNCKRRTDRSDRLDNAPHRRFRSWRWRCWSRLLDNRWSSRLGNSSRRHRDWLGRGWRWWRFGFASQQIGNIARLGNVREINLGLNLSFTSARTAVSGRGSSGLPCEVLAHTLSLIHFDGA